MKNFQMVKHIHGDNVDDDDDDDHHHDNLYVIRLQQTHISNF